MRGGGIRRLLLSATLALAGLCGYAGPAHGAASDPLFIFVPVPPPPPGFPIPPPYGTFNGPCGLGVDSAGNFYVSDYYRHNVDVYAPGGYGPPPQISGPFITQLTKIDPLDGPCGLALDAADNLYVNSYHRSVSKYGSKAAFGTGTVIAGAGVDETHPTGVAVDPATGNVYVDARTHIAVYDSSGAPVMDGAEPLKIGAGSLEDGYGLAYSQFPGTLGRLYVADAATDTVKVYDPALDTDEPVAEIDGAATPNGEFVSLRDSALAVDRVSGELYVVDNLEPEYAEQPDGIVYVFAADGSYKGHLKYLIRDALPPGLAVDNSAMPTQGRVYVTSSNTVPGAVYAYPPGAATTGTPKPTAYLLATSSSGSGEGTLTSDVSMLDCAGSCETLMPAGAYVGISATPEPGSTFSGWSGACSGDDPLCVVEMDEAAAVRAEFTSVARPEAPAPPVASTSGFASGATPIVEKRRKLRRRHHRRHHRRSRHQHAAKAKNGRGS